MFKSQTSHFHRHVRRGNVHRGISARRSDVKTGRRFQFHYLLETSAWLKIIDLAVDLDISFVKFKYLWV